MTKEDLNWRSFTGNETINRQWNLPATPTMYVIDHKGMIRHKWTGKVGERTIDIVLEKLIGEIQSFGRSDSCGESRSESSRIGQRMK